MEMVKYQNAIFSSIFSWLKGKKVPLKDEYFCFVMEKLASKMHVATLHFSLYITNEIESSILFQAEQPLAVLLLERFLRNNKNRIWSYLILQQSQSIRSPCSEKVSKKSMRIFDKIDGKLKEQSAFHCKFTCHRFFYH